MKIKYLFIFLLIFIISCAAKTKYVTVPLSDPPSFYYPNTNMTTKKDLIKEYQKTLIKISEWQIWYKINNKN